MTTHKLVKKLTAKAKNEKPLLSKGNRPVMELQINRLIRKEIKLPIQCKKGIPGVNSNF